MTDSPPLTGLPDPDHEPAFYAGVASRRLLAWIIDSVIVLAATLAVVLVFGVLTLGLGFAAGPVIWTLLGIGYRSYTIARSSATPGMAFFGIEFRRADGRRFDPATAILHTLIYTLCITIPLGQIASIVAMLSTRRGQGLPDLVLATTAINRPVR